MPRKIEIRRKAKTYGRKGTFKGSKGWCDKFVTRNEDKIQMWLELARTDTNANFVKTKIKM